MRCEKAYTLICLESDESFACIYGMHDAYTMLSVFRWYSTIQECIQTASEPKALLYLLDA